MQKLDSRTLILDAIKSLQTVIKEILDISTQTEFNKFQQQHEKQTRELGDGINSLQKKMNDISSELTVQKDLFQHQLKQLDDRISGLQKELGKLQATTTDLSERVKKLEEKQ